MPANILKVTSGNQSEVSFKVFYNSSEIRKYKNTDNKFVLHNLGFIEVRNSNEFISTMQHVLGAIS